MNCKSILEKMTEKDISYFSISLLSNNIPMIQYCNNDDWMELYSNNFPETITPPVQKYITSSTLKVIIWNFCDLDQETKKFISIRNDIVNVSSNLTVLFKKKNYLTAITLGTKKDLTLLEDYVNNNYMDLLQLKRNIMP